LALAGVNMVFPPALEPDPNRAIQEYLKRIHYGLNYDLKVESTGLFDASRQGEWSMQIEENMSSPEIR
jgi:hypothetical protein